MPEAIKRWYWQVNRRLLGGRASKGSSWFLFPIPGCQADIRSQDPTCPMDMPAPTEIGDHANDFICVGLSVDAVGRIEMSGFTL